MGGMGGRAAPVIEGRLGGLRQVGQVGRVEVRAAQAIEGRLGGIDVYTLVRVRLSFAYCSLFLYRSYIVCIG